MSNDARKLQVAGQIGSKGAVRFDQAQVLTDAEKEQARVNLDIEYATDEEVLSLMLEMDALPTLIDKNGAILTDNSDEILLG